jgi:hypothetical protein
LEDRISFWTFVPDQTPECRAIVASLIRDLPLTGLPFEWFLVLAFDYWNERVKMNKDSTSPTQRKQYNRFAKVVPAWLLDLPKEKKGKWSSSFLPSPEPRAINFLFVRANELDGYDGL